MLELAKFLGGYLAVLAVPGPNLLAIGGMAALYGYRSAVPLCLGTAIGAGLLSAGVLGIAVLGVADAAQAWRTAGNLIGVLLLLCVAALIACQRPPEPGLRPTPALTAAAFGAGFLNAATNPVTGTYFASQFLGPLTSQGALLAFVPPLVIATALSFFLSFSVLLARPVFKAKVEAWHGPIKFGAAAVLVFLAALLLGRTLTEAGWRPSVAPLAFAAALSFFLSFSLLLVRPTSRAKIEAWINPIQLAATALVTFASACFLGFVLSRTLAGIVSRSSLPGMALSLVFASGFALGGLSGFLLGRAQGRRPDEPGGDAAPVLRSSGRSGGKAGSPVPPPWR